MASMLVRLTKAMTPVRRMCTMRTSNTSKVADTDTNKEMGEQNKTPTSSENQNKEAKTTSSQEVEETSQRFSTKPYKYSIHYTKLTGWDDGEPKVTEHIEINSPELKLKAEKKPEYDQYRIDVKKEEETAKKEEGEGAKKEISNIDIQKQLDRAFKQFDRLFERTDDRSYGRTNDRISDRMVDMLEDFGFKPRRRKYLSPFSEFDDRIREIESTIRDFEEPLRQIEQRKGRR